MLEKIAITILAVSVCYKIVFSIVEGIYKGTLSRFDLYFYVTHDNPPTWIKILKTIEAILLILSAVSAVYLIISWLVFFLGR